MNDPHNESKPLDGRASEVSGSSDSPAASHHASAAMMQPDDLHNLFAMPEDFDEHDAEDPLAQLRNDPNYAALIRDLEYIAKEARALFEPASETPSDDLWTKIQSQLPAKPDAD